MIKKIPTRIAIFYRKFPTLRNIHLNPSANIR